MTSTTPTPYTSQRAAAILQENGIRSESRGDNLLVGFSDIVIQFTLASDQLTATGVWRGTLPIDASAQLLSACTTFNETQLFPTMSFEKQGERLSIFMRRGTDATYGLSHNQLGAWLLTTVEQCGSAAQWLAGIFPEAVNWNEDGSPA
ncbi:YbjN domain-containing protein [Corynebacterium sp. HMSC073D01]|uniref:YbjN domain-containing protein n=1 Tax=Corynebacterium sp. HMSC073D01 TaxID=1739536 RepID=UPI0008A17008|nr:YbjN domain-containing protein [Corynebacterium sp. HMSC073D01]OFO48240.1 hypothetical protein HMPREF3044_00550 [Corynebacterium sp. HMSC073D01]